MESYKTACIGKVESIRGTIKRINDSIWDYSELSLLEFKSASLLEEILAEEGFSIEKGISGIETAFKASFGSGSPTIGILAEYDALSGLSQKAGSEVKEERAETNNGHGCGHNIFAAGSVAAAIAVKAYLEASKRSGTIILYGCPGEEGVASKAFMACDGEWRKLDAALAWHPGDTNEVWAGSSNSCIQNLYTFKGISAHASSAPEEGRSALDAVELMNIGVQFLREHMGTKCRIHYSILDTGGSSPNVVQSHASVLYMVRSNRVKEALELQERVDKIAAGAAMMTETTFEKKFVDALSDLVENRTLEELLQKNFSLIGVPKYTEDEIAFTDALSKTYDGANSTPSIAAKHSEEIKNEMNKKRKDAGHAMNDFLAPLCPSPYAFTPSSTDVGDVSQQTPTAQIRVATFPNGCPGHSWENVSIGRTSIAHKAAECAAKVLSASAAELFENPAILKKAKEEFDGKMKDGYFCPIPKDAIATPPSA